MMFFAALAFVIPANDFHILLSRRIGPYSNYLHGRYAQAVKAFGRPSSRGAAYESNYCTVRWRNIGLDMDFVVGINPCKAVAKAGWYGATVYTRRWVVDRGVRVGDTVARMRRLYPRARFKDSPPSAPRWVLVTLGGRSEFGRLPLLSATVWGGRVTSLEVGYPGVF